MGIKLPDPLPTAESKAENRTQKRSRPFPTNAQIPSESEHERESFLDRLTRQIVEENANRQRNRQTESSIRTMLREMAESPTYESRLDWYRRRNGHDFPGVDTPTTGEREARRQLRTQRAISPFLPMNWLYYEDQELYSEQYRPLTNRESWDMFLSPGDIDRCLWRPRDTLNYRSNDSVVETRENDPGAQGVRQERAPHDGDVFEGSNGAANGRLDDSEGDFAS